MEKKNQFTNVPPGKEIIDVYSDVIMQDTETNPALKNEQDCPAALEKPSDTERYRCRNEE